MASRQQVTFLKTQLGHPVVAWRSCCRATSTFPAVRLLLHTHTGVLFFFRCARHVARPVPQAFADTRFTAFASVPHLLLNTAVRR